MVFILASIVVPIAVYFLLPYIVKKFTSHNLASRALLIAAALLFFISWYLPSPDIRGEDTAFITHFVGGGVFTGLIWLYICKSLRWSTSNFASFIFLYFLVSGLGVLNELFEFAVLELGLTNAVKPSDTWWDLLANTGGAVVFWLGYNLYNHSKRQGKLD